MTRQQTPERIPPPIPEGLDQWNGADAVHTVFAHWSRAEDHEAPADLLHIYQAVIAAPVDETGAECPDCDAEVPGPCCDCMWAVDHALGHLLRQQWTLFKDRCGKDWSEYWLLPPGVPNPYEPGH